MNSALLETLSNMEDLREVPVRWGSLPYQDAEFGTRAVLDLSWQPGIEATKTECDLLVRLLNLKPECRVLDLCCGPGRHALELASRGYNVTAVDFTESFIEYGRAAAERHHLPVEFVKCDAREIAYENTFDAAIIMENTLSVFSQSEAVRVLFNIQRSLVIEGLFFCDLDNAFQIARDELALRHWALVPNGVLLQETAYDPRTGVQKCRDISVDLIQNRADVFYLCKRIYTLPEVCDLFANASLEIVCTAGDWDGSPYLRDSSKLIVTGRPFA